MITAPFRLLPRCAGAWLTVALLILVRPAIGDPAAAPAQLPAAGTVAAPPDPETLRRDVAGALWWGDFAAVERLYAQALQDHRRIDDGQTVLSVLRGGLNRVFNYAPVSEDYHRHLVALTAQWVAEHAQSPLAHVLHLRARYSLAWWHRGTGYANTVSPDAMKAFQAELRAAVDHLTAHAGVVLQHSSGHQLALMIGRSVGWSPDRLLAIAEAGLQLAPDDDGLDSQMVFSLLPKWGGSAAAVDFYINRAAERAGPQRGPAVYAELYSEAAKDQFEHQLFADSGAQWPRMKDGWQQLLDRFPTAYNVNRFAYLACIARDRPTLVELLPRTGGERFERRAWGANPLRTAEGCRRWARQPEPPVERPAAPAPPADASPST